MKITLIKDTVLKRIRCQKQKRSKLEKFPFQMCYLIVKEWTVIRTDKLSMINWRGRCAPPRQETIYWPTTLVSVLALSYHVPQCVYSMIDYPRVLIENDHIHRATFYDMVGSR